MQLRADQLAGHLSKPLGPIYLVHGDDPLLTAEAGDAIRAAARSQGYTDREILVVGTGFRWQELKSAAGNLSLFGGNKLVDLRIPSGKPGKEGGEALVKHAAQPPDGIITLITLPELDWTARKAAWFTALSNAGVVLEVNAPPLTALPEWIALRLQRQNQKADKAALDFIAQHVEGNLLAAHQEIQKLGLLFPAGQLSLAQVEEAVLNVARYDVNKLRQAFLAGDIARTARLLAGLQAEGVAAPLVLWAMTTEIRTLARLRMGLDRGEQLPALLKTERIFDNARSQALRPALERITSAAANTALQHAARIDRMVKGLADGDLWDEFLQLSLRLAVRRRA